MSTRNRSLLGAMLLLCLFTPDARAAEVTSAPAVEESPRWRPPRSPPAVLVRRPPGVRAGRVLSLTGVSLLAAGGALFGGGLYAETYDFRGEWWEKAAYDRAWLARSEAAPYVWVPGATLLGVGYLLLHIGVPMEGTGLYFATGKRQAATWVSVACIGMATTLVSFSGLSRGFTAILGAGFAGAGVIALFVQFGLNVEVSRRLPEARRHELYRRKAKVQVTVAPSVTPRLDGGGLALVGRL